MAPEAWNYCNIRIIVNIEELSALPPNRSDVFISPSEQYPQTHAEVHHADAEKECGKDKIELLAPTRTTAKQTARCGLSPAANDSLPPAINLQ